MTLATLDTDLIYHYIIANIIWIKICGKLLTVGNIMAAVPVKIARCPTVKGLIYASNAISLSHQISQHREGLSDSLHY